MVFRQPGTREKEKNEEYKQYITDAQLLSSSELEQMELEHREVMHDIDFDPEIIDKINKKVTDDQEFLRNDKALKEFKKQYKLQFGQVKEKGLTSLTKSELDIVLLAQDISDSFINMGLKKPIEYSQELNSESLESLLKETSSRMDPCESTKPSTDAKKSEHESLTDSQEESSELFKTRDARESADKERGTPRKQSEKQAKIINRKFRLNKNRSSDGFQKKSSINTVYSRHAAQFNPQALQDQNDKIRSMLSMNKSKSVVGKTFKLQPLVPKPPPK